MQGHEKQSLPSKPTWETRRPARDDGTGKQRMRMYGVETLYENKRFELFRIGRHTFFVKLKGGLKHACPGLKRITRKEAEVLLCEYIKKDLEGSTRVFGMNEDEVERLMKEGVRTLGERVAGTEHLARGENAQGG